ncbi:hypothetical protein DZE40_000679 [Clostridium beijerinckii]|uniref:Uncharacterized protein n=1 Tax=Clostridium beijerinckii TaxID=1520 RepID=A0A1S8S280_CLOBE|nr:hypothetical protein [Clostridium beijerinckii]OOM59554.1 hypothetical protein CLBCK_34370 [Clostridium beijerinckii]
MQVDCGKIYILDFIASEVTKYIERQIYFVIAALTER